MDIIGEYSRRRLLGHAAAAMVLAPPVATAATAVDAQTSTPPTGDTIQGAADLQHRLTLDTMIDGKGPFRFLVDTGADRTIIADNVALSLGLINGEEVVVQGISRSLPAPTVTLRNLSFGKIVVDSLAAPVLPRIWLGADGYLGLDAIDGRKVTFDFQNHRLTVEQSLNSPSWIRFDESIVRANGSNGRLTATDCTADGVHASAFIDSGAEMTIGNTHLFARLQEMGASYVSDAIIPIIGVTGGMSPGRLTPISNLKLGPIIFRNGYLIISDLPVFDIWGLADRPALFLGMNFLQQASAVSIDFAHKEMRFKIADIRIARRA